MVQRHAPIKNRQRDWQHNTGVDMFAVDLMISVDLNPISDSTGGRRELTLEICPVVSTCAFWYMHMATLT